MSSEETLTTYTGGCHCGAVRFECQAAKKLIGWDCNCSICMMKRNTHFVVPESRFKLLQGEDKLSTYTFGTHTAKHHFCSICGVVSFYIPRSNPDGYAITLWCVDKSCLGEYEIKTFDGQNWEKHIQTSSIVNESKV
eukprot:GFYU01004524.1.p1 GENE.GFYU01004524.1~~GFYU01004524.1.p1  ORF type:complete len:156 (-),score=17.96 GFYU01004524.1:69-479(-)